MPYRLIRNQHPNYSEKLYSNSLQEEFGSELGDPNSIKYYEILSDSNKPKSESEKEQKENIVFYLDIKSYCQILKNRQFPSLKKQKKSFACSAEDENELITLSGLKQFELLSPPNCIPSVVDVQFAIDTLDM